MRLKITLAVEIPDEMNVDGDIQSPNEGFTLDDLAWAAAAAIADGDAGTDFKVASFPEYEITYLTPPG